MEASPMSLLEKFIKESYGSQYVIPVYQRNYTWGKSKQVKQLLDDIEMILNGKTKRHFIGSIVYIIIKTDFMVRERAVVDGQQRLITMFLIVHALRELAIENGEKEIANQLTNNYLENIGESGEYKYRLKPSVSDDNVYSYIAEQKLNEIESSTEDSKIYSNYMYIKNELKQFTLKNKTIDIINAIRELYIVRIELDETDNAQQIFESINSTGEKLTAADLIRNYIMMNKSNKSQEYIYDNYWLKMERIFLDSKHLEEFFRFYLAAKKHTLTSTKNLYETFKDHWEEQLLRNDEKTELKQILVYAQHFYRLYVSQNIDELGTELSDFRKIKTYMPAPFMLYILELYRLNTITKTHVKSILNLINTYLIRRYLAGQDTSAISRFFPTYLKNVTTKCEELGYSEIVEICEYYLVNDTRQKAMFMPDDSFIQQYLIAANAYNLKNIDWILKKLETHENPIPIDTTVLSIEHIMPQTPNEYWKKITNIETDIYETLVNKLGNLTLVAKSDNSAMGNRDFNQKKIVLEKSKHLTLNSEILCYDVWTEKKIELRTIDITTKIFKIFPYKKSKIDYSSDAENRYINLSAREISASGYLRTDNKVIVYAGSTIRYSSKLNSNALKDLRSELLDKDIIIEENGVYSFAEDYIFNTPSMATDFILGGSNNGWDYWKNKDGIKINDCLRTK